MEKRVEIVFDASAGSAVPTRAILIMEGPEDLPDGTTGFVLVKTADGVEWQAFPLEMPDGTTGHVLTKTAEGYEWAALPAETVELPVVGNEGDILTVGSEGALEFAAPVAQVPALPVANGNYQLAVLEGVYSWTEIV